MSDSAEDRTTGPVEPYVPDPTFRPAAEDGEVEFDEEDVEFDEEEFGEDDEDDEDEAAAGAAGGGIPGLGFDLGALGGFGGIFQQVHKMQQQAVAAQDALGEARVTGTAGGGLVTATVSGLGRLVGLRIDPAAVDPADTETLADLIVAAVHNAAEAADKLQDDQMRGFGGGLPGGLGGLGGLLGGLGR